MRSLPPKKKRRNLPEDQRKKLILDAALREFATYGYEAGNVDRIAEMAEVGKGTVYRHFSSKLELFAAVVERGHNALHERFGGKEHENCRVSEHIAITLTRFVDFFVEFPDYYRVMMVEQPELRLSLVTKSDTGYDHFARKGAEIVQAEIRAKRLKRCDPEYVAQIYLALMKLVVERQLYGEGHSRERDIKEAIEITLKGLER